MLKESYSKIEFPLINKGPKAVLSSYLEEFGDNSIKSLEGIKTIFANALRDYIEGNIGEWEFGSLCFELFAQKQTQNLIKKDSNLYRYIFDCLDIAWLSESKTFSKYKAELLTYLNTLKTNKT